jgi:AcrR family transcriptional regulator
MGRHKTITDDAILAAARGVFAARGHTATTRQIADAAGISEAVLYQRFGSKEELFFAALHTPPPDLDALLGPLPPTGDAREYVRGVVVRMGWHFAAVIPLAVRMMTHPAFDPTRPGRTRPGGNPALKEGLAVRLKGYADRGELAAAPPAVMAGLLVSLAHDWALGVAMAGEVPASRERALRAMVEVVWCGLRPD